MSQDQGRPCSLRVAALRDSKPACLDFRAIASTAGESAEVRFSSRSTERGQGVCRRGRRLWDGAGSVREQSCCSRQ